MKSRIALFFLCFCLLFSFSSMAQMPTGQMFLAHEEVVKPSMVKEYEAAGHEFSAFVKANQATMPHFHYVGFQSNDFTYTYVLPIANMAAVDAVTADFEAVMKTAGGAQFGEIMNRSNAAVMYIKEWIVAESPELGYKPATPRLKPEEMKFFHFDVYYVLADKVMDSQKLAGEFAELFKKKNIPDGYQVYMTVLSAEMPAIIIRVGAKDEADFYAASAKNRQALGPEGEALFARAATLTRRFETKDVWARPDLSVPAPPK